MCKLPVTGSTLGPLQHSVLMDVKEEPMRGIIAALVVALGFLTAIVPATLAETITSTENFHTHGTECYGDSEYQNCVEGKTVFHTTQRTNGGYTVVYYSDYTYYNTYSIPGCEYQTQGDSTYHSVSTGQISYPYIQDQQTHQLGLTESSTQYNCNGYTVDMHCVYSVFFHFANGHIQFSDNTMECTFQPIV